MRTVKFLAGLAGAIILLVVAGLLAVWLLVNPNDYKGRVAAAVKSSTGRELVLTGDIKLSVFPWVALELGPASLGNPPGFGAEPFLAFNRAAVRISLWRLLHEEMQIQRVEIDGLDLRLRKDERGVGNWESFGQTAPRPVNAPKEEVGGPVPELAGVRVTHGRVSYQGVAVQKLDLETGAIGGHEVTPVRIGFDVNRGVPDESLTLSAKFTFSADAQYQQLRFAGVSLSGLLNRPGDGRPAHWEASLPTIEVNLTAQTLSVPAYDLSYSSAHVTGKLQATNFLDDLSATGSAALAPLSLREFAPRLGLVLPKTRDPRALAQLSASCDFRYGANALSFDSVRLQLDDTHLKGGAVLAMQPRALRFDLTVDQIDLSRYLGVEQGPAVPLPPKPAATPVAGPETSKLPDADGTLTVGSVHFAPLDFTDVRLTFASKDSVVHLFPSLAQIDGGSYSGNITFDERGALPILSMDEHLSGVDMARLLAATPYRGRLSGHGNVNLKATARGAAPGSVMQTLSGQFDANLAGGALEGIDLGYELAAAQALVKHQSVPSRSGPARTKFDDFRMSAQISSGVAKTTDLIIASPALRVTAQGSANLVNKAIDLQMLASLSKAPGATVADVPLKVTGTYVDPIVRPDVEALAKGELKQKLQDVLKKNGLQGLFGK
jgi:AsmA protein